MHVFTDHSTSGLAETGNHADALHRHGFDNAAAFRRLVFAVNSRRFVPRRMKGRRKAGQPHLHVMFGLEPDTARNDFVYVGRIPVIRSGRK
ncbi:hypothetical protein [uncultured Paracoccus sp.]|uniref:hypothetical protein n=1 Tax=uncultured Paracoccus sp. TaxID=189685 RepID=UPI002639C3A2|nr:hypothetical protein [uncultured Paracoccus sp.]